MAGRAKHIDSTPKLGGYSLDCLRDRPGWKATSGGWTNKTLDLTVEQTGPHRFRVIHSDSILHLTSATGCLVVIDRAERDADTTTTG